MDTFEYDKIVREILAPVYPVIAQQILDKTKIANGVCLDVGTGSGQLGISVAEITKLKVYLLDILKVAIDNAYEHVVNQGLEGRVQTLLGDVHNIPMKDQSVNIVISRGSCSFWENKQKAFEEIYRVLVPGGVAYIGGGFATQKINREINEKMKAIDIYWNEKLQERISKTKNENYEQIMHLAGINHYEIINNESGHWIIITKETNVCGA